ncbi:MAG TPA: hypothetical protein PLF42_02415 [Anaerolineales bacterium]|nr:hypothetical protein [Anaerolineales bacterium]
MTPRRFKHESLLYLLAFLTALALRFIALGALPLADAEAAPALQALRIAQGESPVLAPHPFYILTTSVTFFLYGGGTNFLARLLPALIGSLLVLAPLLFDDRLKPRPSLLLAFFIALDPGLVAISRQAASPIFAIAFVVFAFGFLNKNKPTLTAVFAALALLSGPSIWFGILALAITWAILQAFRLLPSDSRLPLSALPPFLLTFILAGSLFFIVPNGLSAAFASIPAFFSKWTNVSDVTAGRLFLSLLVYQPLAFLLALIAIARGWIQNSQRVVLLGIAVFVPLLLAVFLPARQMGDLVWMLIPLNTLAALELCRCLNIHPDERIEVAGVSLLTVFIWTFAWLGLSGMAWIPSDTSEHTMRILMLIGILVLLVLSLLLVAMGWSIRIAQFGGVFGMVVVLGALGIAGAFGSAGLRSRNAPELWWLNSTPAQANLLQDTVRELSQFSTGDDFSAGVVIAGLDIPSLEWALRDHPVQTAASLDVSSSPPFVITSLEMNPALVAAYRGQDFTWRQSPGWQTALPVMWMRWFVIRDMPQTSETIILWARDDLFLDK